MAQAYYRGDMPLFSNWAVAWCLPEVLIFSGPLVELRVPPPCSVTMTEGEYGSKFGGDPKSLELAEWKPCTGGDWS